jgi:ankyrin repeat protein
MLGSRATQLARQSDDSLEMLFEFYHANTKKFDTKHGASTEALVQLIQELSVCFEHTVIVIDGLDECLEGQEVVFETIARLHSIEDSAISTLVFSRPQPEIKRALGGFASESIAASSSDIRLYVAAQLESRFKQARVRDPKLKEEMLDQLVRKSGGMFQWARCQIEFIAKLSSDRERRKTLDSLPPTLHATYDRILTRVLELRKDTPITLQNIINTIRWIVFSKRPLRKEAIMSAVALQSALEDCGETNGELEIEDCFPDDEIILSDLCGLVIESPTGELQFSHFSVQEYFEKSTQDTSSAVHKFHIASTDEKVLGSMCLDCLNQKREIIEKLDDNLIQYVAQYWGDHIRPFLDDEKLHDLVCCLFAPESRPNFQFWCLKLFRIILGSVKEESIRSMTPIHLASVLGLVPIVKHLIQTSSTDMNMFVNEVGSVLDCAMMFLAQNPASTQISEELCRLLVEAGAKALDTPSDALPVALQIQCFPIAKYLVQAGFRLSAQDMGVLKYLRKNGFSNEVAALLRMYNGRARSNEEETPSNLALRLDIAVVDQPTDVSDYVELALVASKNGLISELKRCLDYLGTTPDYSSLLGRCIRAATKYGHRDIVQILLSAGADPKQQCSHGRTAFHNASISGSLPTLQLLTENCALHKYNIPGEDEDGLTPILLAIQSGVTSVVKHLEDFQGESALLLETSTGLTAFHAAAICGREQAVSYLLSKGFAPKPSAKKSSPLIAMLSIDRDPRTTMESHVKIFELLMPFETSLLETFLQGRNLLHFVFSQQSELALGAWRLIRQDSEFDDQVTQATSALDEFGDTPIHDLLTRAMKLASLDRSSVLLLYHVLNDTLVSMDVVSAYGRTPLLLVVVGLLSAQVEAAKSSTNFTDTDLRVYYELIEILRTRSFIPTIINMQDFSGRTSLSYVMSGRSTRNATELVDALLENGADANIIDDDGDDAIMAAAQSELDNTDLILHVIRRFEGESVLNLERKNKKGSTLLHFACNIKRSRSSALMDYLAEQIATSGERDNDGVLPIHVAMSTSPDLHVTEKLLQSAGQNIFETLTSQGDCWTIANHVGQFATVQAFINLGLKTVDDPIVWESEDIPETISFPVLVAAEREELDTFTYLLDRGAEKSVEDSRGLQLTHILCGSRNQKLLEHLPILKDLDFNTETVLDWKDGKYPGALPLHFACATGEAKTLEWLISHGKYKDIDVRTAKGYTALHLACLRGEAKLCELLLKAGASTHVRSSGRGSTVLHYAVRSGSLETCRVLIENSADMNAADESGRTPLHWAARNGFQQIASLLLAAGSDFLSLDNHGRTASRLAISYSHLELSAHISGYFSEDKPQEIAQEGTRKNESHSTISHSNMPAETLPVTYSEPKNGLRIRLLAASGQLRDCRSLLDRSKSGTVNENFAVHCALFRSHDCKGSLKAGETADCTCSALCLALMEDHKETSKWLLDHGADGTHSVCACGASPNQTPLHIAADKDMADVLSSLLGRVGIFAGAMQQSSKFALPTPLHLAAKHRKAFDLILKAAENETPQTLQRLLNEVAPSSVESVAGCNVLHIACSAKMVDNVSKIVSAGADINARSTPSMKTALHWAVEAKDKQIVELLCENGSKVNALDKALMTPLLLAVHVNAPLDILEILHKYGAKLHSQCEGGHSILHFAIDHHNVTNLAWAIANGVDPNVKNMLGVTPIFGAEKAEEFEVLMSAGADLTKVVFSAHSMVHNCSALPMKECAKVLASIPEEFLLESFHMRTAFSLNSTPLYVAAFHGNLDLVKFFVQKGADLNTIGGPLGAAVHAAWAQNHFDVTTYLLGEGAKLGLVGQEWELRAVHFWQFGPLHWQQSSNSRWAFVD